METEERRDLPRTKSLVKRTVLGTVTDETYGAMSNHLYIVDVSEKGMRINLDRQMEPESRFQLLVPLQALGFGLDGELETQCRVVWARPLAGGTCVLGLEFIDLADESKEMIRALIDHWAEKQGVDLVNLPEPVDAKLRFEEDEAWSRMVGVRAISHDGFRFPSRKELEAGQSLEARILLESGTVQSKAQVQWCKPMPNGAFDVGCQFFQLSESDASFITLHLRRCRHRPL